MIFLIFSLVFYTTLGQGLAIVKVECPPSDYECIRASLARNSNCSPGVWGSVPSSVTLLNRSFRIPSQNSTYFDQYAIIKNIQNCFVSAFNYNTKTNEKVLGISCPNIKVEARRNAVYHSPNADNTVYSGKLFLEHPLLQFTANIKNADDIDLCKAFVYTYLSAPPKYKIIPFNEKTRRFLAADGTLDNNTTVWKEELLVTGYYIFYLFVNNILCDFGCKV